MNAVLGPGGNRDSSELVPMCSPPCEMSLRSRAYVFGVSTGKRGAVKVEPILKVRDGDHVVLHYDSRLPVRVLGWILLIGGSVGGGLLMASGLPAQDPNIPARVAGGATLLAASLGFGLWFANVPDRAFGWVTR